MVGERDDCDHRQPPQENAEQQQFEPHEVALSHAAANQLDVPFLLVYADVALLAVIPIQLLHHFNAVVGLANQADLALLLSVRHRNAGIDEARGQPNCVQKDNNDRQDEEEGVRVLSLVELEQQQDCEEVDEQEADCENEICVREMLQLGPRVRKGSPLW